MKIRIDLTSSLCLFVIISEKPQAQSQDLHTKKQPGTALTV
ncbi:hypothetical protein [Dyadobacter sp. LHD-138]|nr:hypothetical protein [Dyadobacter sp. LHD-138]MDQ6479255.1 hypothetical protein [Dyadobacter sp. LHD-138]